MNYNIAKITFIFLNSTNTFQGGKIEESIDTKILWPAYEMMRKSFKADEQASRFEQILYHGKLYKSLLNLKDYQDVLFQSYVVQILDSFESLGFQRLRIPQSLYGYALPRDSLGNITVKNIFNNEEAFLDGLFEYEERPIILSLCYGKRKSNFEKKANLIRMLQNKDPLLLKIRSHITGDRDRGVLRTDLDKRKIILDLGKKVEKLAAAMFEKHGVILGSTKYSMISRLGEDFYNPFNDYMQGIKCDENTAREIVERFRINSLNLQNDSNVLGYVWERSVQARAKDFADSYGLSWTLFNPLDEWSYTLGAAGNIIFRHRKQIFAELDARFSHTESDIIIESSFPPNPTFKTKNAHKKIEATERLSGRQADFCMVVPLIPLTKEALARNLYLRPLQLGLQESSNERLRKIVVPFPERIKETVEEFKKLVA